MVFAHIANMKQYRDKDIPPTCVGLRLSVSRYAVPPDVSGAGSREPALR